MIARDRRRLLRIDPVDTLFFRDGRRFAPAARAASGLPKPQTVAGALRTAMIRLAGIRPEAVAANIRRGQPFRDAVPDGTVAGADIGAVQFRGPLFGLDGQVLFPAPAILRQDRSSGKILRLDPLDEPLPGWRPQKPGMRPLWCRTRRRLRPVSGYLAPGEMIRFLEGSVPGDIIPAEDVYAFDDRTGIGIDPDRSTAGDGRIYGVRMLSLTRSACLYAELTGPPEALDLFPASGELVALGGEGRHAVVTPEPGFARLDRPRVGPNGETGNRLIVLTTPAILGGGYPRSLGLLAASVPGYETVSGWDLARKGPKPNRFTVPAGAVYFLRPHRPHPGTGAFADPEDAAVGWGSYLEGTWNHA